MNPTVTIVMPVSRADFLDKLFHNLEILECKREKTNLLVIVDGDSQLFVDVRNRVEFSKFSQRLCIQYKNPQKHLKYNLEARRLRISDIHNEMRKHLTDCEFVFGLEDDTLFPIDSLKKLLGHYFTNPYIGMIEGVELGRWGIPYVGAWKCDDIYEPKKIQSTPVLEGLQEIDAGGLYCFLTTRDNYMMNHFKPFGNNSLGPDVDFGIELRRQGMQNYADFSIKCIHKGKDKDVSFSNSDIRIVTMVEKDGKFRESHS